MKGCLTLADKTTVIEVLPQFKDLIFRNSQPNKFCSKIFLIVLGYPNVQGMCKNRKDRSISILKCSFMVQNSKQIFHWFDQLLEMGEETFHIVQRVRHSSSTTSHTMAIKSILPQPKHFCSEPRQQLFFRNWKLDFYLIFVIFYFSRLQRSHVYRMICLPHSMLRHFFTLVPKGRTLTCG